MYTHTYILFKSGRQQQNQNSWQSCFTIVCWPAPLFSHTWQITVLHRTVRKWKDEQPITVVRMWPARQSSNTGSPKRSFVFYLNRLFRVSRRFPVWTRTRNIWQGTFWAYGHKRHWIRKKMTPSSRNILWVFKSPYNSRQKRRTVWGHFWPFYVFKNDGIYSKLEKIPKLNPVLCVCRIL